MSEKGNRSIDLIELLSTKERKKFAEILEGGKRSSLSFLFNAVCVGLKSSKPTGLEKELLYRLAFDQPYSKNKDYLLRNEFRLLSKELVSFLSIAQIKKNFRDNSLIEKHLFLQSLVNRKASDFFNREWEKVATEAEEQLEFSIALEVRRMAIDQLVLHRQATIENYNSLLELLGSYQNTLKRYFMHQHLFGKHKQVFAERTLQALGSKIEISSFETISIDPTDNKWNDAFANHFVALTQSYQHSGKEKVKLLKNASEFVKNIKAKRFDQNGALASINAGIALEYFLLREFEESLPYHIHALEFGANLEDGKLISFVFNYLSTLLRLEKHTEAIALIEEYTVVWEKLPRMRDRFLCLKAMCHVFENDPKAAETCIPKDRKSGGMDHYYYYRFVQIIILYQKQKVELAINEAENFEHTVRYNDNDADYLRLIQSMKKFLMLRSEVSILPPEEYGKKSDSLKIDLGKASQNAMADRALLYRWLVKELDQSENKKTRPVS